mgnify:CR=1 FL=1
MFRRLFALLLISLIASQSVLAAADTHLDAQSGDDHQQVNHSHSSTPNPAVGGGDDGILHSLVDAVSDHEASHDDQGDSQSVDCQHCCHCHNGSQVLASVLVQPELTTLGVGIFNYAARPDSLKFPPALRPPIV